MSQCHDVTANLTAHNIGGLLHNYDESPSKGNLQPIGILAIYDSHVVQ